MAESRHVWSAGRRARMRLAGSRTAATLTRVSRGGGVATTSTTHLFRACSGPVAVTGVC